MYEDKHNSLQKGIILTNNAKQIVPNIVHYVLFTIHEIQFIHYVSILSVLRNQRPEIIYIHCDCRQLRGEYARRLSTVITATNTRLIVRYVKRPTEIFGRTLNPEWAVWHGADLTRLRALIEFGGVYLDRDVYVIKPLNEFFNYNLTIDFEIPPTHLGNQVIIGTKNATALTLWLNTYLFYDPSQWYYNGGELPAKLVINARPDLVHRLNGQFGVKPIACTHLYYQYRRNWREMYHTVHTLIRGDVLSPSGHCLRKQRPEPSRFDEFNIRKLNNTFGEMAREVFQYEQSLWTTLMNATH